MVQSAAADEVFQALCDSTRRRVLERLSQGPATVSELAKPFGHETAFICPAPFGSREVSPGQVEEDRPGSYI